MNNTTFEQDTQTLSLIVQALRTTKHEVVFDKLMGDLSALIARRPLLDDIIVEMKEPTMESDILRLTEAIDAHRNADPLSTLEVACHEVIQTIVRRRPTLSNLLASIDADIYELLHAMDGVNTNQED